MRSAIEPPNEVLAAFGAVGPVLRLPGGQGSTYLAGDVVLKPVETQQESEWAAELLNSLEPTGFRVPVPIRSKSGEWVAGGWCAWSKVAGREDLAGHWEQKMDVSRLFHQSIASVPKPDFIDTMDNSYRRADKMAWGELEISNSHRFLRAPLETLVGLREGIDAVPQLIHGDLDGNILFDGQLPPAIIDLAPYWRPADYAIAIIVADGFDRGGADESILQLVREIPSFNQLLLRAEMFRIGALDGWGPAQDEIARRLAPHLVTVDRIAELVDA